LSSQILDFLVVLLLSDDLEIGERWLQNASRSAPEPGKIIGLSGVNVLSAQHAHVNEIGNRRDAEALGNRRPTDLQPFG
jgi:hypothetical protein